MQNMCASPANDDRAVTVTSGRKAKGAGPQAEARGLEIVRLHQTLEDWRDYRRLAYAEEWPALASEIIDIEIRALETEIARQLHGLF